jgi:hypothetical protein
MPESLIDCLVTPAQPQQPPRKQWFDKVADVILGDDDGSGGSSANRYALICQHCFAHNGLVKESMWEDARTLLGSSFLWRP